MDSPYSGAAVRAAHFASRPSVAGLDPRHTHANAVVDFFNPQPAPPANQAHTLWEDGDEPGQSGQPNLAQVPVTHWWEGLPAVQSGLPYGLGQQLMQDRMMLDHSQANYVPNSIRLYTHASQGQVREFVVGRQPWQAGEAVPENVGYLMAGRNAYDQTNQPNEVYGGDAANVGRYRLGVKTNAYGLYDNPLGVYGQVAYLRAYTGLYPQFPYDKPRIEDASPGNPNSAGTAHWGPTTPAQTPSMFALPTESAITDYVTATEQGQTQEQFYDNSGML